MQSKNINHTINDYIHKPQRNNALALHNAYELEKVDVPSIKDIVVNRISIAKHFNEFLGGLDEFTVNEDEIQEHMELCDLLGIDYDSIKEYGDNDAY